MFVTIVDSKSMISFLIESKEFMFMSTDEAEFDDDEDDVEDSADDDEFESFLFTVCCCCCAGGGGGGGGTSVDRFRCFDNKVDELDDVELEFLVFSFKFLGVAATSTGVVVVVVDFSLSEDLEPVSLFELEAVVVAACSSLASLE